MPNTKERDLFKEVSVVKDVSLIKVRTIKAKDVDQLRLWSDPLYPDLLKVFEVVGIFGGYVICFNPMGRETTGDIFKILIDRYVMGMIDYDERRKAGEDLEVIDADFNLTRQLTIEKLPQVFAA